mmetsp:Transcript_53074/g.133568  ORF Transcript_53074/g.133568 Transcript_53074/m.133568 type:complete len:143 (+) Transcript_53074:552-980(+)
MCLRVLVCPVDAALRSPFSPGRVDGDGRARGGEGGPQDRGLLSLKWPQRPVQKYGSLDIGSANVGGPGDGRVSPLQQPELVALQEHITASQEKWTRDGMPQHLTRQAEWLSHFDRGGGIPISGITLVRPSAQRPAGAVEVRL